MRKQLKRASLIGLLFSLFCSPLFAAPAHPPIPKGLHFDYTFSPNQTLEFENPLFWEAGAVCYGYTKGQINLKVVVLHGSGKINGHKLHRGDSMILSGQNGARFELEADGQSKASIVNLDNQPVEAKCEI